MKQIIVDAFEGVEKVLTKVQSEVIEALEEERKVLAVDAAAVAKQKKANTKRAKVVKDAEIQLSKDRTNIQASLKLVIKDKELKEVVEKVNNDRAYVDKWRKDLTERENIVKGKLEEVEKRELKLLEKQRAYKKELEQKIVNKFMTD